MWVKIFQKAALSGRENSRKYLSCLLESWKGAELNTISKSTTPREKTSLASAS
jgi:hypothetical protein